MYRFVSRFMTYRRFYVWRARYNYLMRAFNGWTLVFGSLLLGLLYSCWIIWKISNPPLPRVHPEAARLHVQMVNAQAIHRIAVAQNGGGKPGEVFATAHALRAGARRAVTTRGSYLGAEAKTLQAQMLADMADYITASGVCAPYLCGQVSETVMRLRRAGQRTAELDEALRPMLAVAEGALPKLEGEQVRLRDSWSDDFQDVIFHGWVLTDVQVMHTQMMAQYPARAPMPWLSRLMDKPHDPLYEL